MKRTLEEFEEISSQLVNSINEDELFEQRKEMGNVLILSIREYHRSILVKNRLSTVLNPFPKVKTNKQKKKQKK